MARKTKIKITIPSKNLFRVIGIGASAGGMEAFKQVIKAIPVDSGMAYILVQHLDPNHHSMLVELLQKDTLITVQEITNNVNVEPDHIYVIPPNKLLTANDGKLRLSPRSSKDQKSMAIDVFFTSLAQVYKRQAIGIVLSGTGHDGTSGLRSIKKNGGLTFAQLQKTAAFKEMPQSAIDASVVDYILSPDAIINQLLNLNKTHKDSERDGIAPGRQLEDFYFKQILEMLDLKKDVDFTYYKQTTVRRRIARRMVLKNLEKIEDYFNYLKANPSEIDLLFQDMLIPVTDFFRDPKVFKTFSESVLPSLVQGKAAGESIRIWVVGCSTGQEAYSIAICLKEFIEQHDKDIKIQIFATDISEAAIVRARAAFYIQKEAVGISAGRLEKYFNKTEGGFQLNKSIRDLCVFATHNVLINPPFANMDLISCRNVLIYMDTFLQKKAMTTFHYALKDHGKLLLGKSESIGSSSDLFKSFVENENVYERKSVPGRFIQTVTKRKRNIINTPKPLQKDQRPNDDFQRNADDFVLSKSPAGVVINEHMEIVQFRGATGNWLESASGKPNLNVLKMAKNGLSVDLRNSIHKAKSTQKRFVKNGISMGGKKRVNLEVIPLLNTINPYFLIQFEDPDEKQNLPSGKKTNGKTAKANQSKLRLEQLEQELSQAREDFRIITEDQDAGNEALLSTNEELLSSSEELHSLNEELEISKEELQSTVEELSAANQELAVRNEEINHSRKYAEAIVTTIREPLIVLDKDLRVKSANTAFYKTFKGTEPETEGKLFYELENSQWDIPDLRQLLERTLQEKTFLESYELKQKFLSIGERIMLLNARKIFGEGNKEHLILLAIEDITERRALEGKLKETSEQLVDDEKMFSDKLEKKVKERTQELKEANANLEHSNENLEQFAFLASHDLQEPLRKIKTYSNILSSDFGGQLPADGIKLIEKIFKSSERMSILIQDVLDFSRIESSKNQFVMTDLSDILDQVLDDYAMLMKEKNAKVNLEKLPLMEVVPFQINQLFSNLISNWLKFTRENIKPVISISSREIAPAELIKYGDLDQGLTYHEIIFEDNGIGFEEKYAKRIFLIFQRLHSIQEFPGTGIGLALCKKITIIHHGEIFARSEEGIGSSFHIILPLKQMHLADSLKV